MTETKKAAPAFVIDTAATIKWPVTVHLPVDGGEVVEFQFTGEFKRLSEEDLDKLLGVGDPVKSEGVLEALASRISGEQKVDPKRLAQVLKENAELFPQLMEGWDGVMGSDGRKVPFAAATLQQQVTGPNGAFLSTGLWRAIAEIRNGARLGN